MSVRPPEASPSSDRVVDAPATPSGWSAILKPVFIPASAIIFGLLIAVVVFARSAGDALAQWTADLNTAITDGVGWWYVIVVNLFLVFAIYCAVSRVGRIRLGRDGERPEFGVVDLDQAVTFDDIGVVDQLAGIADRPGRHADLLEVDEVLGQRPAPDEVADDARIEGRHG